MMWNFSIIKQQWEALHLLCPLQGSRSSSSTATHHHHHHRFSKVRLHKYRCRGTFIQFGSIAISAIARVYCFAASPPGPSSTPMLANIFLNSLTIFQLQMAKTTHTKKHPNIHFFLLLILQIDLIGKVDVTQNEGEFSGFFFRCSVLSVNQLPPAPNDRVLESVSSENSLFYFMLWKWPYLVTIPYIVN